MVRIVDRSNPPRPRCGHAPTVRSGHTRGQRRWWCARYRRSFRPTACTAVYQLKVPPAEVTHALLVVLRRGSPLAAEKFSGHKYRTVGRLLRRAADHIEALVHDLHLSDVEVDEFWPFVRHKGVQPQRPAPPAWASNGAA